METGKRGSRYDHSRDLLCRLTGAEDALVVNNNAGAVFLVLAALCRDREVLISRGQLVEIGGGFRIPDVLRLSGATLVEVGTTNRTHLQGLRRRPLWRHRGHHAGPFQQLQTDRLCHRADLGRIGRHRSAICRSLTGHDPILIDDLGSGTLLDTAAYGLSPEPTVQASIAAGADIVTFSGDKLLGGPQAGLILGRADLIAELRRFPLLRALRVDKMTLAALDATLRSYERGQAVADIPVWRMIAAPLDALRARAEAWRDRLIAHGLPATTQPGESAVGGGSLPGETLPTVVLALASPTPDALAHRLRAADLPVICRIQADRLLFDPRTVLPEGDDDLIATILHTWKAD